MSKDYTADGRLTITGTYNKYKDDLLEFYKAESSKKDFKYRFNPIIHFDNGKAAADYTEEDIKEIERTILKKGRLKKVDFKTTNIYLLRRLIFFARYDEGLDTDKDTTEYFKEKDNRENKKSLSVRQIIFVVKEAIKGLNDNGKWMAILLMLFCGLRNGEAAAIDFCDIIKISEYVNLYVIAVYEVAANGTNIRHGRGKTYNAVRFVPVPIWLMYFIRKRIKYIKSVVKDITDDQIKDLPLACIGNDFTKPCQPKDVSSFGKELLRKLYPNNKDYDKLLNNYEEYEELNKFKELTTYVFRRNYLTHIFAFGLTEEEITAIFGHDIISKHYTRNMLMNNMKMFYEIKQLIDAPFTENLKHTLTEDEDSSFTRIQNIELTIPKGNDILYIGIKSRVMNNPLSIKTEGPVNGHITVCPSNEALSENTIITEYIKKEFQEIEPKCVLSKSEVDDINNYFKAFDFNER